MMHLQRDAIRFEPPGHDQAGWWGPTSSTLDWCERNYQHSHYIAEFFNCISNIGLVASGMVCIAMAVRLRFELRFIAMGFFAVVVGLGSAAFHGTLLYWAQMWDEVPMVWSMLSWIYCSLMVDSSGSWPHAFALAGYGCFWAVIHVKGGFVTVFQVHFVLLVVLGIIMLGYEVHRHCMLPLLPVSDKRLNGVHDAHRKLRLLAQLYVGYILLAFACWLVDQFACPRLNNLPMGIPNPQFHAWWHLLAGMNVHCGLQFHMALRQSVVDEALPATKWGVRGLIGWVVKTPKSWVGRLKRRGE